LPLGGGGQPAPPRPAPDIVESGFLTNYDLLTPSPGNRAQLVYHRPKTDISRYETIRFNRVHLWRTRGDGFGDINNDELQRLADDLYFAVRSQLESNYELVDAPQEATMEIHLALIDISEANVALEIFATEPPRGETPVERTELGSASRAFVESALIELEINDASSQEVLLATVDRNIGRPASNGSLTSTADVNEAFNIWAERIAKRLRERRSGKRRR
jgi:hypothetical protein